MGDATVSLLTAESAKVLADIRNFFENDVRGITIDCDETYRNVVTLGNECQKKLAKLKKEKTEARRPWNEKADEVSKKFDEAISIGESKKTVCQNAVNAYHNQKLIEARKKAAVIEAEMQAERDKLEKLAGSREKRAQMYADMVYDIQCKIDTCNDEDEKAELFRQLAKTQAKVVEYSTKTEETLKVAASMVAPVAAMKAEIPKVSGTKTTTSYEVAVTDIRLFLQHCLEIDQPHLVQVNMAAIKDLAIKTEGAVKLPGIAIRQVINHGFSGR